MGRFLYQQAVVEGAGRAAADDLGHGLASARYLPRYLVAASASPPRATSLVPTQPNQ